MKAFRRTYLEILLLGGVAIFCLAIWRDDTSVLQQELAKTQSEVRDLDHKPNAATTRLDPKEMPRKPLPLSTVPATAPSPQEVGAQVFPDRDYRTEYGDIVYGTETKVQLGNGVIITSLDGVMVSDQNQKLFVGNLQMEDGNFVMSGESVVYDAGNPRVTGKNMKITTKRSIHITKEPNQGLEHNAGAASTSTSESTPGVAHP